MNGGARLLGDVGVLLVELLVLLFAVSAGLAVTVRRVGLPRLHGWLGGGRLAGTLKGMALGFVMPFCTYSAIPTFVAMVDAGARTATLAAFLLAAPLLDPLVVAVLVLLFGWQATLAYAAVTAGAVLVLALASDVVRAERFLRSVRRVATAPAGTPSTGTPASESCGPDPFRDQRPWRGRRVELREATEYARGMVRGLALPMVVAVAVAAAITGFVPEGIVARMAGPENPLAVPTAALLGVPFYVSTESFLPVAAGLHTSGMGLGAVFALVISAAGVNLPELALLSRLMDPRLLVTYTAAIVGAAITVGYLVPALT